MSFKATSREVGDVTVIDMDGRITLGEGSALLRDLVRENLGKGRKKIVMNLAGINYIDSTGLGTMVICFTRLQKAGGAMKLVNLNRRNIELLLLTKLSTVMQIFGDEQESVNSFFPEREIKHFDILNFIQQQKESEQTG